ncbi:MAG: hypothetical protein K9J30_10805 [Bacteroidales bacterium]|nr:hypothetical protein [Bacteroidales bacterium]
MAEHILGIVIPLIFIAASAHIIWKSTDGFEIAADYLGRKMSRGVKGATINAVASSMPEFLTTLFFLFYVKNKDEFVDSFSGGLGVVAGSAVFNILVIPLAIILFGRIRSAQNRFTLNRKVIQRDGLFLIFANVAFILIISKEVLTPVLGLMLILIYVLYLVFLRKGFGFENDYIDEPGKYAMDKIPLTAFHFLKLDVKQILLNGRELNRSNAWSTLIISTVFMSLGTWLLVKGTELLGAYQYVLFNQTLYGLDLPIVFLSVLLASAATSIPDTMVSVRDARKGNHDDSISNAIGSNIFDLSFALGLPLLIYTLINGPIQMSSGTRVLSISFWLCMWLINIIAIPVLIYYRKLNRRTGIVLAFLYLFFIAYIIEETSGISRFSWLAEWVIDLVN